MQTSVPCGMLNNFVYCCKVCIWHVQVEILYKLQLVQIACTSSACTSCNPYKISCTSCNLHRISLSNNLTLYNIAVQVGFKGTSDKLNKLTILLKIFLILSV